MHEENAHIGHEVHRLSKQLKRYVDYNMKQKGIDQVTAMHGWVLGYLYDHRDEDIYQRDIETRFCITRSAVTNIVKHMEDKGYIRREAVEKDARLKKLILTPKGEQVHLLSIQAFEAMEKKIRENLTREDIDAFFVMAEHLRKIIDEDMDGGSRK